MAMVMLNGFRENKSGDRGKARVGEMRCVGRNNITKGLEVVPGWDGKQKVGMEGKLLPEAGQWAHGSGVLL